MGIFDGEVDNSYKPFPEGMYHGKITNLEMRTSKNGNDYLNLEFTIQENKRRVWDRLMWHNEKCINVTKGKLEALGFTRDERKRVTPESIMDAVNYMVDGKIYNIKIKIKDDQNVVSFYNLDEESTGETPW